MRRNLMGEELTALQEQVVKQIKEFGEDSKKNYEELRENHKKLQEIVERNHEDQYDKNFIDKLVEDMSIRQEALDKQSKETLEQAEKKANELQAAFQRLGAPTQHVDEKSAKDLLMFSKSCITNRTDSKVKDAELKGNIVTPEQFADVNLNYKLLNEIDFIGEYTKELVEPWNPRYIDEERELIEHRGGDNLKYDLPRDIRWAIEEDIETGVKLLANHYNKPVVVSYTDKERSKLPKEALEKYLDSGSGSYERFSYRRGLPKPKRVDPDDYEKPQNIEDEILISLYINPNKDHYLHNTEMRKEKKNDYCPVCILHANTAITKGAGDKSSRKTKGRKNREKNQLFYANKGDL